MIMRWRSLASCGTVWGQVALPLALRQREQITQRLREHPPFTAEQLDVRHTRHILSVCYCGFTFPISPGSIHYDG